MESPLREVQGVGITFTSPFLSEQVRLLATTRAHHFVEHWQLVDVLGGLAGHVLLLQGVAEGGPGGFVGLPRLPQVHCDAHVHGDDL